MKCSPTKMCHSGGYLKTNRASSVRSMDFPAASVGCTLLPAFVCLGLLNCNHLSTCMVCLSHLYDTRLLVHPVRCSLLFPSVGMLLFPVFKELRDNWALHSLCIRLSLGSAFLRLMCDFKKIKRLELVT